MVDNPRRKIPHSEFRIVESPKGDFVSRWIRMDVNSFAWSALNADALFPNLTFEPQWCIIPDETTRTVKDKWLRKYY